MKKITALALAAMTAVMLTSCGGSKNSRPLETINICGEELTVPCKVDDLERKFTTELNDYGQLELSLNGKKIGNAEFDRGNSDVWKIDIYSKDLDQMTFDGIELGTKAKSKIKKKYGKPHSKSETGMSYHFDNSQELIFLFNDNKELDSVDYFNYNMRNGG